MALGTCANCGHKVSTTARSCPKCGVPPPKLVYCTRCGRSIVGSATICPGCGAARYQKTPTGSFEKHALSTANQPPVVVPSRSVTKEAAIMQPIWQCPKCKSESVQSLSVIYAAGSTSSTQTVVAIGVGHSGRGAAVGGGVGQASGSSSSELAKITAPPPAPAQPSGTAAGCATAIVGPFLLIGLIVPIFRTFSPPISPTGATGGGDFVSQILTGPGPILLLLFGPLFGYFGSRLSKSAQQAKYLAKLPAYNKAMSKWRRSYFCHRCGNIFELQI